MRKLFSGKKRKVKKLNIPAVIQSLPKQLLQRALSDALVEGISVNIFATRDKTAIGVNYYMNKEREVFYAQNAKELANILNYAVNDDEVDDPDDDWEAMVEEF